MLSGQESIFNSDGYSIVSGYELSHQPTFDLRLATRLPHARPVLKFILV